MQVETHIEQYEFHCQPCNYEWYMTYEVRVRTDLERHFFYLNGIPATSPTAGRLCPNCWQLAEPCQMVDEPLLVPSRR